MDFLKKNYMGVIVCFTIAVPSWLLGKRFPVVGGAVIAIILGMIIALFWNDKGNDCNHSGHDNSPVLE